MERSLRRRRLYAALFCASFFLMMLASLQEAFGQQRSIQFRVFTGITAAQTSGPLPNNGQAMHILTVVFPAEIAAVSGLRIRMEGSFDNSTFFPICEDITSAPLLGGRVYQIAAAFGAWPYVRVRSLNATGSKAMTVYYSGHVIPVVSTIQQQSDRFIL